MQRRLCLSFWWWQFSKFILHNTALEGYFIDLILQLGLPEFCTSGPPFTENQWGRYKLMLWHAADQFTLIQWHLWDTEHRWCLRSYTPALMRRLRPCDHQHIHSNLAAPEPYCLHDPNSISDLIVWIKLRIENWNSIWSLLSWINEFILDLTIWDIAWQYALVPLQAAVKSVEIYCSPSSKETGNLWEIWICFQTWNMEIILETDMPSEFPQEAQTSPNSINHAKFTKYCI